MLRTAARESGEGVPQVVCALESLSRIRPMTISLEFRKFIPGYLSPIGLRRSFRELRGGQHWCESGSVCHVVRWLDARWQLSEGLHVFTALGFGATSGTYAPDIPSA